jgi:Na+:H+ antiporter, NhaA family
MIPESRKYISSIQSFLSHQASGGIVLMVAAAAALAVANSGAASTYFGTLSYKLGPLSVHHWVNDALMAVFFLLVGLEIKRELVLGELSTWQARVLPGASALGGMVAPAAVFVLVNLGNKTNFPGWAIPTATDIAFALGVLALLGSRVPPSLRIFLTALAILDDLGAVLVIALFYSGTLSALWLSLAAAAFLLLLLLNYLGVRHLAFYLAIGVALWLFVLWSGVHATVAGVLLAFTIPLASPPDGESPLESLEHTLQPWVGFLIVPIFGFANAGVSLTGLGWSELTAPLTLGIAAGLFVGKQIGVMGASYLVVRWGFAKLPERASWAHLYGVSLLCGIGFTMSLFIGTLAFSNSGLLQTEMKIGVLTGSIASALVGALVLFFARNGNDRT